MLGNGEFKIGVVEFVCWVMIDLFEFLKKVFVFVCFKFDFGIVDFDF